MNSESTRFRRGAFPAGSFAAIAALSLAAVPVVQAGLVHRWSFNNAAGSADGTTVDDSVGGAGFEAFVQGNGATYTGTALRLPGGGSGTAPYIDLPNDLIGANSPIVQGNKNTVSLECWVTVRGTTGGWARFLDFGTNEAGELFAPGGGFAGTNYLLYSAATDGNYNTQQLELKISPTAGDNTVWRPDRPVTVDQQLYFVITVDSSSGTGSIVNLWRNGEHVPLSGGILEGVSNFSLSQITDVNNWLGRSNYSGDANLNGEYNEFRIYDHILTDDEIFASRASGPTNLVVDADGDGMPDGWEADNGVTDPAGNPDADGLTNVQEFQRGTNPNDNDSDDDGLTDEKENNSRTFNSVNDTGTNPLDPDTDRDGLKDGVETRTGTFLNAGNTGTDPHVRDSDLDLAGDGTEVASGSNPTLDSSLPLPKLDHRYSFSETSGYKVADSIGGASGAINGAGASWAAGELTLAGGNPNQAAYVALPAGLISNYGLAKGGRGAVTIEGWATVLDFKGGHYARLYDFGSSQPGGVNGAIFGVGNWNGGAVEGMDTFWLSGYTDSGGDFPFNRAVSVRKADGGVGANTDATFTADSPLGNAIHFVTTFDESSGRLRYFENGFEVRSIETSVASPITLGALRDINNWLGRSNYTGDGILHAKFNEIRIYDGALTDTEVAQHFTDGADAVPGTVGAADTDSDGIRDWYERAHGLNPAVAADASADPDGDGVTNLQEFQRGSSPLVADTDGDGLSDAVETNTGVFAGAAKTGSNPAAYDTDGDFASDHAEVLAATSPVDAAASPTALLHRWSFNNPAGDATATTVTDAVSGQPNAVILGDGAQFTGTGLALPGGSSGSAAYVDLPNDILSPLKAVTVETWVTLQSNTNPWSRIFDFGNTLDGAGQPVEVTAPGGGGGGGDYFFVSPTVGADYNVNRIELHRNEGIPDGARGNVFLDHGVTYAMDEVVHFVAMVESTTAGVSRITLWRNGVPLSVNIPTGVNLSDFQDVNNWIGRSNYLGDANLNGTIDEFRIYNGLLSAAQVAQNLADGPDAAIGTPDDGSFQISVVTAAPGQPLSITFPTETGKSYQAETSTSMTATTWSIIGPVVNGTGNPATVTDNVNGIPSTVLGRRFYRVREVTPAP